MKRTILFLTLPAILLALIIGCQKGPSAEDIFTEAKKLHEDAKYTEAVVKYEQLVELHQRSKFAAQSQFMIGFIYANELDDLEKAKTAYETFLERYTTDADSGMVASAHWELENLGKDIDEIEDLSLTPQEETEADDSE